MSKSATSWPTWVPSSWLLIAIGTTGLWSRLNFGDRSVLVFTALLVVAIPLSIVAKLVALIPASYAMWSGVALGFIVFLLVALAFNATMVRTRSQRFMCYVPESDQRRAYRILAEFVVSALICAAAIFLVAWFLRGGFQTSVFVTAVSVVLLGQLIVHLGQFLQFGTPTARAGERGAMRTPRRSRFASWFVQIGEAGRLPNTSSRFLLKAITNPLIWLFVVLILMSVSGTALLERSVLLALSTLSSILMIFQLALIEPRVGNGAAIGASSKTLPIGRAVQDLVALAIPHSLILCCAFVLIALDAKPGHVAIACGQFGATIWILWLALVSGALPTAKPAKFWAIGLALIATQVFPAVIPVILLGVTIALTYDLRRLSKEGPASWPH